MEENTPSKTPTKKIYMLSPSAVDICVLCVTSLKNKNDKLKLWDNNQLSTVGSDVEYFLADETLNKAEDLQCICRNCMRLVRRYNALKRDKLETFLKGRDLAASNLRVRVKRGAKIDYNAKSKKKLSFVEQKEISKATKLKVCDIGCCRKFLIIKYTGGGSFSRLFV